MPARELRRGRPTGDPGQRTVATASGWKAWVPEAPAFPYALVLCPDAHVPDLPSLDDPGRDGLARLLVDVLARLDRVFDAPTPYMLWIHQRPFHSGEWPYAKVHVEIVSPWRAAGVPRYVAAGEQHRPSVAAGFERTPPRAETLSYQQWLEAVPTPEAPRSLLVTAIGQRSFDPLDTQEIEDCLRWLDGQPTSTPSQRKCHST